MFSDIYFAMSKNYFNKAGERKDWGEKRYVYSQGGNLFLLPPPNSFLGFSWLKS